jgi:hypothetical protein
MVDEKEERYEEQEEGEYHFSDDQVSYDTEPEAQKKAPASTVLTKESILAKLSQHRRAAVGGTAFIVLIGIVYKMLVPTSLPPATDFSQTGAPVKPLKTVIARPVQVPIAEKKPILAVVPQNQAPVILTAAPSMNPPSNIGQQPYGSNTALLPAGGLPMVPAQSTLSAPLQQSPSVASMNAPVMPGIMDGQAKNIMDRLAALEQQNAAVMNLLQTEYAQKISDYETQGTAMRGKMEELTKRINRMETSLNQITQLLQGASRSQASGMTSSAASFPELKSGEPKTIYTVQAIIPGRAWLKSEAGDTVTVAEGDLLKAYGRVTKIDPYDGIVAIDTGSKVITLSYGVGAD